MHEIALSELNAELGDRFVISEFRFEKEIMVLPVGELDYYRRTGETYLGSALEESKKPFNDILARQDSAIPKLIDAFLAEEFIKPAITDADYKITSAFSNIILNESEESDQIDAIIYPSVVFRGGLNFAIKPNSLKEKIKLINAEIIEITDVIGYGIFDYRPLGKLKSVNHGLLEWTAVQSIEEQGNELLVLSQLNKTK